MVCLDINVGSCCQSHICVFLTSPWQLSVHVYALPPRDAIRELFFLREKSNVQRKLSPDQSRRLGFRVCLPFELTIPYLILLMLALQSRYGT